MSSCWNDANTSPGLTDEEINIHWGWRQRGHPLSSDRQTEAQRKPLSSLRTHSEDYDPGFLTPGPKGRQKWVWSLPCPGKGQPHWPHLSVCPTGQGRRRNVQIPVVQRRVSNGGSFEPRAQSWFAPQPQPRKGKDKALTKHGWNNRTTVIGIQSQR